MITKILLLYLIFGSAIAFSELISGIRWAVKNEHHHKLAWIGIEIILNLLFWLPFILSNSFKKTLYKTMGLTLHE